MAAQNANCLCLRQQGPQWAQETPAPPPLLLLPMAWVALPVPERRVEATHSTVQPGLYFLDPNHRPTP